MSRKVNRRQNIGFQSVWNLKIGTNLTADRAEPHPSSFWWRISCGRDQMSFRKFLWPELQSSRLVRASSNLSATCGQWRAYLGMRSPRSGTIGHVSTENTGCIESNISSDHSKTLYLLICSKSYNLHWDYSCISLEGWPGWLWTLFEFSPYLACWVVLARPSPIDKKPYEGIG